MLTGLVVLDQSDSDGNLSLVSCLNQESLPKLRLRSFYSLAACSISDPLQCSNTPVTCWTLPASCPLHFPTLPCPPWHLCPTTMPHSSSHPSPAREAEGLLCMCSLGDINPRLYAPTKQRKHLLTAKALTNSGFQMNPAPCGAEGGERPGE